MLIRDLKRQLTIGTLLLPLATTTAMAGNVHFGVGTHFAFDIGRGYDPATQRPLLRDLGVDSFRDDVNGDWARDPSAEHPVGTRLGRLNEMLMDRTMRPVLILRGDRIETGPKPRYVPRNDAETTQFVEHARRIVATTRTFDPFYEIWNEWNVEWRERPPLGGWLGAGRENPDFSPENYVRTARAIHSAIKGIDPNAFVLTGAIGDDADWTWTKRALAAGLSQTGDGVSVHFYNHCARPADRTAENLIAKTQTFRDVLRDGGETRPIYITEFGWPTDHGDCGIPLDLAAANVAQYTLWASAQDWIGGIWAYELRDSGRDPLEPEHNFGLYDYDNRGKPAACAYREAIALGRELQGLRFLEAPAGLRWLEGKDRNGVTTWIFWATARDATFTVTNPQNARYRSLNRICDSMTPDLETTTLEIGMMPVVVQPDGIDPSRMDFRQ